MNIPGSHEIYAAVVHKFAEKNYAPGTDNNFQKGIVHLLALLIQNVLSKLEHHLTRNSNETILGIETPDDIYLWLSEILIPGLYDHQPALGDDLYCYPGEKTACVLNEGNVIDSAQCHEHLVKGTYNCPMWVGAGTNCCEPCETMSVSEARVPYHLTAAGIAAAASSRLLQAANPNADVISNDEVIQKYNPLKAYSDYNAWRKQMVESKQYDKHEHMRILDKIEKQKNNERRRRRLLRKKGEKSKIDSPILSPDRRLSGGSSSTTDPDSVSALRPSAQCGDTTVFYPNMFWEVDVAVDNLSENCAIPPTIPFWMLDYHTAPGLTGVKFCPTLLPKEDYPPRVFDFNTLLVARMTLKRAKMKVHDSTRFAKSYPHMKIEPDGNAYNTDKSIEDTADFGLTAPPTVYH